MDKKLAYIILIILLAYNTVLRSQQRFPKPEFETGYVYPEYQVTEPRNPVLEYIDVFVLITVLGLTTYITLKKRSRKYVIWSSVFTLAYFGFYRQGCICPIGAIQNVSLAVFNESYALPLTALLFFFIPLVFALLYGRQFCAGACPLGAIQELTGIYPVKIPKSIEVLLSSVPYIYLALAILFAATDSHFIICKYDPFVGIFRLNAPLTMVVFGSLLLLAGLFVNRPYCRFLCPYGVLLGWLSRFSGKHVTITPDECINCKLCKDSCPYNAILPSTIDEPKERNVTSRSRFITFLVLIPVFTVAGSIITGYFSDDLAIVHRDVRLANEIRNEEINGIPAISQQAVTFRESGETLEELYAREEKIKSRYSKGAPWAGAFLGFSLGIGLLSLSIRTERKDYLPHKGKCFSCARCFEYCPVHIDKTKKL
jgi:NosR/NirI family nitrous oxide reductase transcriptional regulator